MIKAIISDIGNVLVKVDLHQWVIACKEKDIFLPEDVFADSMLNQWIELYGRGKITTEECAAQISKEWIKRAALPYTISFENFKAIWNSVILKLYPDAIDALQLFRNKGYQIYALSDTNEMHIEYIEALYQKMAPTRTFKELFDKPYYSYLTGYTKAQDEAWLQILKEKVLKPGECLFIDDLEVNIKRAKRLGMQAFHYKPDNTMQNVLATLEDLNCVR